jgi:hypothetical protein
MAHSREHRPHLGMANIGRLASDGDEPSSVGRRAFGWRNNRTRTREPAGAGPRTAPTRECGCGTSRIGLPVIWTDDYNGRCSSGAPDPARRTNAPPRLLRSSAGDFHGCRSPSRSKGLEHVASTGPCAHVDDHGVLWVLVDAEPIPSRRRALETRPIQEVMLKSRQPLSLFARSSGITTCEDRLLLDIAERGAEQ